MFFTPGRLILYIGAPLLCFQLCVLFFFFKGAQRGAVDFRTYYAAGRIAHTGGGSNLYNYGAQRIAQEQVAGSDIRSMRFMSPPFAAILFEPLSLLPFLSAYLLFLFVNLVLVGIAVFLVTPYLPALSARTGVAPALLFLTFFPVGMALGQGQLSVILLALYCGAYVSLRRAMPFLAGLLVSVALLKFQIAVPVVLLFLVWRQWRFVTGFAFGTAALALVSLATLGITSIGSFWHLLVSTPRTLSAARGELSFGTRPDVMPNLYGFFHLFSKSYWGVVFTVVCSILLLAWAARKSASLPLAILIALLLSYHLYIHDFALILLPVSLLLNRELSTLSKFRVTARDHGAGSRTAWKRVVEVSALAVLLAGPFQLLLMGWGGLPWLVIPVLILALTFDTTDEQVRSASVGGSETQAQIQVGATV